MCLVVEHIHHVLSSRAHGIMCLVVEHMVSCAHTIWLFLRSLSLDSLDRIE